MGTRVPEPTSIEIRSNTSYDVYELQRVRLTLSDEILLRSMRYYSAGSRRWRYVQRMASAKTVERGQVENKVPNGIREGKGCRRKEQLDRGEKGSAKTAPKLKWCPMRNAK